MPYNAILGYPALAKFMVETHPCYNVIKMPGYNGVITIVGEKEDTVRVLKRACKAVTAAHPDV